MLRPSAFSVILFFCVCVSSSPCLNFSFSPVLAVSRWNLSFTSLSLPLSLCRQFGVDHHEHERQREKSVCERACSGAPQTERGARLRLSSTHTGISAALPPRYFTLVLSFFIAASISATDTDVSLQPAAPSSLPSSCSRHPLLKPARRACLAEEERGEAPHRGGGEGGIIDEKTKSTGVALCCMKKIRGR